MFFKKTPNKPIPTGNKIHFCFIQICFIFEIQTILKKQLGSWARDQSNKNV